MCSGGDKIAFRGSQSNKLNIINYDGTGLQSFSVYDPISIQWSPDGTKLAFVDHYVYWQYKLYIMNNDGTGLQKLTDYGSLLSWSPDGTKFTFSGEFKHYLINSDGTGLQLLTDNYTTGPIPLWNSDGTKLIFKHENNLYRINIDGTNSTLVYTPQSGKVINQIFSSPDRTKVFIVSKHSSLEISDLDVMNFDGSNLRHLLDEF